ncbi:molybdopterin-dependent oxidoreductase [Granulicella sp. dw_53]|uniref:molybdopterin-dependent oxidoreductase n=1 Tax=Granulicella sp. dw_53 TaxID=2719792 RepID=UPI0021065833|nr:molybdopterin-dependent oxidoreductase [Granulicella sp. dw_53]
MPRTSEKPDGESLPVEPLHAGSETSTGGDPKVTPVVPFEQKVEPQLSTEELSLEPLGPAVDEVNAAVLSDSRRHTRRSFVVAAAATAVGYGLYNWLDQLSADEMQPGGYRKAFETNAALSRAIFDDRGLAPTYSLTRAENLRVNGVYGLKKMLEPTSYRLQLVGSAAPVSHPRYSRDVTAWEYLYVDEKTMEDQGHDTKTPPPSARTSEKMPPETMVEQERQKESRSGRMPRGKEEAGKSRSTLTGDTPGLLLTMEDVLRLPRYELVTQFKCIEGWSQIVHWAGIRMVDFLEAYPPALVDGKEPRYVYMETPDGDYYTGYDLHVCRHPQTLLVTEMMGEPLTQYHGAPLRLHMPTKYGYKQIKRIGLISYTNSKPDDYWTKLGYDWYAGL